MARYREKTPEDIAWNIIRREITRALDTQIQNAREKVLNHLLSGAFREYQDRIGAGEIPEIESKYKALASAVVGDIVDGEVVDDPAVAS